MKRYFFITFFLILFCSHAFAATYYVKSGGNDGLDGLSDGNAWATIGKINTVNFGNDDIIQLKRESVFTDATLTLNSTSVGRSGITIQDYNTGAKPRIDGNSVRPIVINHALVNLTLKNLDISGSDTASHRVHIEHVNGLTIDGLDYNGHTGSSAYYRSNCFNIVRVAGDIEVTNCTIQNLMKDTFENSVAAWGSNDAHGIMLWYPGDDTKLTGSVSIHDNVVNNVYADCLQMAGVRVTSNVYNNIFSSFGENAIDLKSCRYTNIYHNEMAGNNIGGDVVSGYWGPSHMVIHGNPATFGGYVSRDVKVYDNYIHTNNGHAIGFGVNNVEIYRNYFKDVTCALKLGGGNGNKIHSNIIEITPSTGARNVYGGTLLSGICFRSSDYFGAYEVYNNTIYINSTIHLYGIAIGGTHTNTSIKNNICYITRNNSTVYPLYYNGGGTSPDISHNVYYNPNHTNRINWSSTVYDSTEQAAWISAGHTGALFSDPLLNADLTLQATSPAIDVGVNLGASYDDGLNPTSTWPDSVTTLDQDLYGAGWEIGAFVFDLTISSASPVQGATGISITTDLTWTNPTGATNIDLLFDKKTAHDPPTTKIIDGLDVETY